MDSIGKIVRDYKLAATPEEANAACKKLDGLLLKEQQKRARKENEWRLVVAFLEGDQWLRINRRTKLIDKERDPSEEAPWRVRMVSNQMIGIYQTLLARMTQNDPIPEAIPATGDPSDVKSAQLAEVLIQYLHDNLDLDDKLVEAVGYSLVGQGYWEVYWDANARTPISYIVHPSEVDENDEPVLIPAGSPDAESLRVQAEVSGTELEEHTTYEGEIGIEVLSPFELYLMGGKTPSEAHSAIKVKGYPLDYISERWGEEVAKQLKPDGKTDVEIENGRRTEEEKQDLVIVKQLYVKPSNALPEGLYKVWAQGKVLHQADFPYEHGELPFARFGGIRIPGAQYDASLLFQLIPLQKELNKTVSQIIEYKNLTLRPQIISPVNSLRTRPTSKPGQVIEYEWRPGMPQPDWRELNNIPQYVFTHIDQVLQRINDVSGQHEASQGRTPTGARSGDMLSLLMERDDSRQGLMIKDMERAMSRAYRLMLRLAQQFYSESRTLEIRGSAGILETKTFEAADLAGAKDVRLSPGTMIPKSKAFQADELRMLLDAGHISPQQYLQMSEFGGSAELSAQWAADRKKQQREIDAVKRNEPVASPTEFDDHGAHLDVLDLYLKSIEFESLPDEQKQMLMEHRSAHSDAIAQSEEAALAENIRTSIAGQLRGNMTPSVIAAILNKAGVQIDPAALAQEIDEQNQKEADLRQQNLTVESELKQKELAVKSELDQQDLAVETELKLQGEQEKADADLLRQEVARGEEQEAPEDSLVDQQEDLADGETPDMEEETMSIPEQGSLAGEPTLQDALAGDPNLEAQIAAEQAAQQVNQEQPPLDPNIEAQIAAAQSQVDPEQVGVEQSPLDPSIEEQIAASQLGDQLPIEEMPIDQEMAQADLLEEQVPEQNISETPIMDASDEQSLSEEDERNIVALDQLNDIPLPRKKRRRKRK